MYYENDAIEFYLNTGLSLTAATNMYVKYELSDGTTGQVEGTGSTTYVLADLAKDIIQAGELYYQPYVSWDNGTTYYHGDKKHVKIEEAIEVSS